MARRVFFSFHNERAIARANVVRNSWMTQDREDGRSLRRGVVSDTLSCLGRLLSLRVQEFRPRSDEIRDLVRRTRADENGPYR